MAAPAEGTIALGSNVKAYSANQTPRCVKWGKVVTVYGAVSPRSQVAAGGSLNIGTVPDGYRPIMGSIGWVCQGSGGSVWHLDIESSGAMTASRYRNGATNIAIPTDAWLSVFVTYVTWR